MTGAGPSTAGEGAAEDARLVAAAQAGDRGAFARLYERYARVIHGVLISHVPHADADDLTQEVFVKAMRSLGELREPGAFGAWLLTSAKNRAASWLRSRKSASGLSLVREPQAPAGRETLTQAEVLAVIRTLPEAYRETLVLRLVEGLTGPEIAERTGLTHGSVRVNLHRGMEMLREKLAEVAG